MPPTPQSLRAFWILWAAQAGSLLGSTAVQFALIWWLTATTGSAAILATATLVGLVPQIALGPVIGALVDRWNRKVVMLASDTIVGLASLALAYLFLRGEASVTTALILLGVRGLGDAIHGPALTASMSLMVPEQMQVRIQGLNQMVQGSGLIVAAPIGAVLYEVLPMAGVMLVDVVTAVPALFVLIRTVIPQPERDVTDEAPASLRREIADGFRWVARHGGHMLLLVIATLVNALLVPVFSLLPLLIANAGGQAGHLALLNSAFGIGLLGGGVLIGAWGGFRNGMHTTLAGMVVVGLATVLLGLTPGIPVWPSVAAIATVGVAAAMTNAPIHALLQATVPPEMQGRVLTLFTTLATAATPIGLLAAAPAAELLGVRAWYMASGVLAAAVAAGAFLLPTLTAIGRPAAEGHPEIAEPVP